MAKIRLAELAEATGLALDELIKTLVEAGFAADNPDAQVDREAAMTALGSAAAAGGSRRKRTRQRASRSSSASPGTVVIKKYGNRRLYSTEHSRYLTLVELEDLVREGRRVQILDAASGDEITSQVLTQILVEGGRASRLPAAFLEQMIRLGDDALQSFIGRYLTVGLDVFLASQREVERRYQQGLGMWNPFGSPGWGVAENLPPYGGGGSEDEMQRLRSRLEDLERRVESRAPGERKRTR